MFRVVTVPIMLAHLRIYLHQDVSAVMSSTETTGSCRYFKKMTIELFKDRYLRLMRQSNVQLFIRYQICITAVRSVPLQDSNKTHTGTACVLNAATAKSVAKQIGNIKDRKINRELPTLLRKIQIRPCLLTFRRSDDAPTSTNENIFRSGFGSSKGQEWSLKED